MTSTFVLSLATAVLSATLFTTPATAQSSVSVSHDSSSLVMDVRSLAPNGKGDSLTRVGPRASEGILALARKGDVRPTPLQGNDAHIGAGSNVALMGVGLAGIVIGSFVDGSGGTMIIIGGGVVGLIGLFRYLR